MITQSGSINIDLCADFEKTEVLKKIADKNGDFCRLLWYSFDDAIFKNSVDSMTSFDCTLKARVLKELHVLNDSNTFTRQVYRIGGYMSFDNYI